MQKLIGTIVCLFFFGLLAHANAQSLKLEVHPQSNNYWLAVSDVDGAFPTSTIELREASGAWIRMSHDYNPYWRFWTYQSTSGTALTFPLSFRFTANNGAQVTFTSALVSFTGATQVIDSLLQYNGAATPATKAPVQAATDAPVAPTEAPVAPTEAPTAAPVAPTEAPVAPTEAPVAPTEAPTAAPVAPTEAPVAPTGAPTDAPTGAPTDAPTGAPTSAPVAPTEAPAPHTRRPTRRPTHRPTERPAATTRPTERPTERPAATTRPTERPTERPAATTKPTERPAATTRPTTAPTVRPAATTRPTTPSTGGCGGKTKLLVPLYMYPAAVWDKVVDGASKVETVAIINPSSGPTNKPSNSFVTYMNKLEQAGVDMIGYVYTQYGSRSINSVKADINTYATQFPLLKGIFLDEVSNKADKESYYKELYNYIMGMPGWKYDIINPGAVPTAGYFDASTTIVSLENYGSAGAGSTPSYASCANKEHFSAIVHTVSSSNMRSTIDALLAKQYFGYLYVTDGAGGCCTYNTLASYYPAMVDYIASKNN